MKGTIDQVEAFFSGITGVWGRVLTFFGTCWISFGFVFVFMSFRWSWMDGFGFEMQIEYWYLVPMAWMYWLAVTCLAWWWWWGVIQIVCLAGAFYAVIILEADLFRSMVVLFVAQGCSLIFQVLMDRGLDWSFDDCFSFYGRWHPLQPLIPMTYAYALWRVRASWLKEKKGEDAGVVSTVP